MCFQDQIQSSVCLCSSKMDSFEDVFFLEIKSTFYLGYQFTCALIFIDRRIISDFVYQKTQRLVDWYHPPVPGGT